MRSSRLFTWANSGPSDGILSRRPLCRIPNPTKCSHLFLIGSWEALTFFYAHLRHPLPSLSPPPPSPNPRRTTTTTTTHPNPFFSAFFLLAIALFSFSAILNSILSTLDGLCRNDRVGMAIQLQSAAAALFLLYAVISFFTEFTNLLPLPLSALNLIALFAFGQEFLLFYLQRKDPSGLENRYFDLLLVPTAACFLSTLLQMGIPK